MPKTCTVVIFDEAQITDLFLKSEGTEVEFNIKDDTVVSALVVTEIDANVKEYMEYDSKEVADIFFDAAKGMVKTKNTGSGIHYNIVDGKLSSVLVHIGAKLECLQ